jgi:hypothetical protein
LIIKSAKAVLVQSGLAMMSAIKELFAEHLTDRHLQSFEREISTMARIHSPFVVPTQLSPNLCQTVVYFVYATATIENFDSLELTVISSRFLWPTAC